MIISLIFLYLNFKVLNAQAFIKYNNVNPIFNGDQV